MLHALNFISSQVWLSSVAISSCKFHSKQIYVRTIIYDELGRLGKETAVACFRVLSGRCFKNVQIKVQCSLSKVKETLL